MRKRRVSAKENIVSKELLDLIRVTPEMTEKALGKLKYKIYPRPEVAKTPRGKLWCPYCGDWRKFGQSKKTPHLEYLRCEKCNISTEDFYVKKFNNLWGDTK
jgi:hypothetical protein